MATHPRIFFGHMYLSLTMAKPISTHSKQTTRDSPPSIYKSNMNPYTDHKHAAITCIRIL